MAIICTRMAIFGHYWPFFLLEPHDIYQGVLHVKRMRLFKLFAKMAKVLLPKNHPKIEKMAILSFILAILGHFFRFSPDYLLDICFSDQQDFTDSKLVLFTPKYSILRPDISNQPGPFTDFNSIKKKFLNLCLKL